MHLRSRGFHAAEVGRYACIPDLPRKLVMHANTKEPGLKIDRLIQESEYLLDRRLPRRLLVMLVLRGDTLRHLDQRAPALRELNHGVHGGLLVARPRAPRWARLFLGRRRELCLHHRR